MLKFYPYFDGERRLKSGQADSLPASTQAQAFDNLETVWTNVGRNGVTASLACENMRDDEGNEYFDFTCNVVGRITLEGKRFILAQNGWLISFEDQAQVYRDMFNFVEERNDLAAPAGATFADSLG